ncbi:VanW family protein [Halobacillus shinanisalinarum]|uniref:VanW family protein n=1 Tax=Halobacillus shinanisalinarum TaxID=2932258 RepID=A0ABY4GXH2_9BACI|nr:VanW family protein [Halobacillus shinanisalinarum]UOQ92117.1 VanW family protein [Halobacillus shinanisalinarum]
MKLMVLSFLLFFILPQENMTDYFSVTKDGETVARVNRTDFTIPYLDEKFVDKVRLETFMDDLDSKLAKSPVNATIDDDGNIVQGKAGTKVNHTKLAERYYNYFYSHDSVKTTVPMVPDYPQVDGELLADIRTQQIGKYLTFFKKSNNERTNNIDLAAKAINNHVVFPGEMFSFNQVVGKRTKEKGYLRAPVIVKGELAEDIGGGICQVSSTLFNAADDAGLKIIERYSHSRKVPYVPPGRDATVSWYGPDFTFKNEYNQPILIRAKSVNGQMMVQILSSDRLRQH